MTKRQAGAFERLATLMAERADELDLDWIDVAQAAGITVETVRAVRRGKNEPSRGTKRGLEEALRWSRGSVNRILEGGEPTPLPKSRTPDDESLDDLDARIGRIRRNPDARRRLIDILVAARLGEEEQDEGDDRARGRDAG